MLPAWFEVLFRKFRRKFKLNRWPSGHVNKCYWSDCKRVEDQ